MTATTGKQAAAAAAKTLLADRIALVETLGAALDTHRRAEQAVTTARSPPPPPPRNTHATPTTPRRPAAGLPPNSTKPASAHPPPPAPAPPKRPHPRTAPDQRRPPAAATTLWPVPPDHRPTRKLPTPLFFDPTEGRRLRRPVATGITTVPAVRELLADTARMRQPRQTHRVPRPVGRRLRIRDTIRRHHVCGDQLPRPGRGNASLPPLLEQRGGRVQRQAPPRCATLGRQPFPCNLDPRMCLRAVGIKVQLRGQGVQLVLLVPQRHLVLERNIRDSQQLLRAGAGKALAVSSTSRSPRWSTTHRFTKPDTGKIVP